MFFSRQPKETPDEMAVRLNEEGRLDEFEEGLRLYKPSKLKAEEKERYYYWWGIMAFRRRDRETAFERFKEGLRECPDSTDIRFSLGQEHQVRGEIDEMFSCFDGCLFPKVSGNYAIAAARWAYLWGHPEKGVEYLAPICEAYFDLGIADDHYVSTRGLPGFTETWSYLVSFAGMMDSFERSDDFLRRAKSDLSHYDFEQLGLFYDAHKRSDFSEYTAWLAKETANEDVRFPQGYRRVQLAALNAMNCRDSDSAVSILQDVVLGGNDFRWLEDIILILIARSQWRTGMLDFDGEVGTAFIEENKLSLEPDHAFQFAFLDLLDELRPFYQSTSSR